jgi:hypothetical protein
VLAAGWWLAQRKAVKAEAVHLVDEQVSAIHDKS